MDDFKLIKLTRGKFTLVDNEDFEWLNQWKWLFDGKCAARAEHIKGTGRWPNQKYKHIQMHRTILEKYNLLKDNLETDHINRNPLDNQKKNLRMVTHIENSINRGLPKNNSSGFKGVTFDKDTTNRYKKWKAHIKLNNKHINLGRFLTKEEAALAYNKIAKNNFGEYCYLNSIGG
jgi:hypothetical protein